MKAIRVQDGYARVVPEMCVLCGNCIVACPSNAKQVRNDLPRVKELLASGRKVVVSLAPSFVAQFPGLRAGTIDSCSEEAWDSPLCQKLRSARSMCRPACWR